MARLHIAIDGPAGAGKSTIAKRLSKELNIIYVDTGAMYRALGLKALRMGISPSDKTAVAGLLPKTDVRLAFANGVQRVLLDGEDVSEAIRSHEVSKAASDISVHGCVREKMVEMQQRLAEDCDVVMDGRDIGTHVLPHAPYKFFLTATVEERARRRYEELAARGAAPSIEALREDIRKRDYTDMNRAIAPLRQAPDAILVDTTGIGVEALVAKLQSMIADR